MRKAAAFLFFLLLTFLAVNFPLLAASQKMVVTVPVADIRANKTTHAADYKYDPNQETQVLKGETVIVHKRSGKWALVECPEQMEFTHKSKWEGYPGWILWKSLTKDLSQAINPDPSDLPADELRGKVLEAASNLIGAPYFWGGRSLYNPINKSVMTGVDCSGLINLSFRQIGWLVPRDAHEQFMKAKRLEPSDLKPGDNFFLAKKENPEKIVHVGFIAGPELLLEAPQSGETVRKISFRDRFGTDLKDLKNGAAVGDRIIYFGTLFTGGS